MVAAEGAAEGVPVTEVSVVDFEGIPAGSMLSVRAGGFRRQRLLSRCSSEPFVFRSTAGAAHPLQVDVLIPAATSGQLGPVGAGEHRVELRGLGTGGAAAGAGPAPGPGAMSVTLRVNEGTAPMVSPEKPSSLATAQRYMDDHLLKDKLTHALMRLLHERPVDPMRFLSHAFCSSSNQLSLSSSYQLKSSCSSTLPFAGAAEQPMEQDAFHVLPPCVSPGSPTLLLDFGSGETGFYSYEMDELGQRLTARSSKVKEPFFASFVEPWRVGAFCDALLEQFSLAPSSDGAELAFYAGATGLHRELLMGKSIAAQRAKSFLREAQQALSETLGGRPTKIWLFVLSGLLEAQLELYATEWLVSRSRLGDVSSGGAPESPGRPHAGVMPKTLLQSVFKQLDKTGTGTLTKEDFKILLESTEAGTAERLQGVASELATEVGQGITFEEFESTLKSSEGLQMAVQTLVFSGTISAGGGSCQMAMMSGPNMPSLQLFTVPVGNRVPIVEGEFSKPVRQEQREAWATRVRSELSRASFPRGVRGLYVGISAVFHAVNSIGMADRFVSRSAVVAELGAALARQDPEDQRSIANLILVHELLQWVFDEEACFIFKRNWKVNEEEFVATWNLGLFTQQHQVLMAGRPAHRRTHMKVARTRVAPPEATATNGLVTSVSADRLFEVPFVAWPLMPSYLLDIGSGEIGLYVFEADLVKGHVRCPKHVKVGEPFYEGFVAKDRVQDFAEKVVREFGLQPGQGRRHEVIAGGTTGLHREMLLSDQQKRDEIFGFLGRVEEEMARQLQRQTIIRIFVPSGELEAQFELRGVEWLIGQANLDVQVGHVASWMVERAFGFLAAAGGAPDDRPVTLPTTGLEAEFLRARLKTLGVTGDEAHAALHRFDADTNKSLEYDEFLMAVDKEVALQALVRRCNFCGTISAGGGSSQLTLTGCVRSGMSQMFSMPIGNRLPLVQRLFSSPVTWEERNDWVERIRDGLRSSQFPQGVTGLFVGISAMYHAAKKAGITDRIVPKQEAMKAFADTLARLDAADHRTVANLTLAQEIIRWVFDEERSCLLFKRNWCANATEYVAGWTLGWYVTQFEGDAEVREMAICNIQRISRGKRVRQQLRQAA